MVPSWAPPAAGQPARIPVVGSPGAVERTPTFTVMRQPPGEVVSPEDVRSATRGAALRRSNTTSQPRSRDEAGEVAIELDEALGERAGEGAGDDLAVDRVGDHEACAALGAHESEVLDVAQVVLGDGRQGLTGEDRLDDAAHGGLTEMLGEAVEVGVLAPDQDLLGGVDVCFRDRLLRVLDQLLDDLLAATLTERLNAPGDTLGEQDMDRAIKDHVRRRGGAPA